MSVRFFLVLMIVAAAAGAARAADLPPRLQLARQDAPAVSVQAAARMVQDRFGGRVLMVVMENENGRLVYRFKILAPSGEVREVRVDAGTGDME